MSEPTTNLVFLDTETTSLDKLRADVIEAAWAVNDGTVRSIVFPHTLAGADPEALRINRYYERGFGRWGALPGQPGGGNARDNREDAHILIRALTGATIVAENYGFDTAMLLRKLGYEPWHYRPIELSSIAMVVFGLDRPEGLHKTAQRLRDAGYDIPMADHTARADVECLRACYATLRDHLDDRLARAGDL